MQRVSIDGSDYIELTRDEALARFAAAWREKPDAPLKELYRSVYAQMQESTKAAIGAAQPPPKVVAPRSHASLLPSVKIGGASQ